jgi:penicillin V acylase-like amidase (Ntn superfamily)
MWTSIVIACTTFLLGSDASRVVGKSYDWDMGQGLVVTNKRGVAKQSLPLGPSDKPLRWVSKHASLTFNQYGRELPNSGINDAGLVVEIMWLDSSKYPAPDARPAVSELQVIQWWLDSFGSTAELTAHTGDVRVLSAYGKVHYLACDASGSCAAIEFLDGKLVVTPGVKALANHSYADSRAFLDKHQGQLPPGPGSLERFTRASTLSAKAENDLTAQAFHILESVKQEGKNTSQWNIVYQPAKRRVWFRTHREGRIKQVDLDAFDPSCRAPVEVLDIDAPLAGDVRKAFKRYDDATNAALVHKSLDPIAAQLPPGVVDKLVHYPAMLECTLPESAAR